MNTVEPEVITVKARIINFKRQCAGPFGESDHDRQFIQDAEIEKNKWFIKVLERDCLSDEEEKSLEKEKDILSQIKYNHSVSFRDLKMNYNVYRILKWLKLIEL